MKNYTIVMKKKNKILSRLSTHSLRRFLTHIRGLKFTEPKLKAYLRINYGRHKDNYNKNTDFFNDGSYENKRELIQAFNSFNELKEEDFN